MLTVRYTSSHINGQIGYIITDIIVGYDIRTAVNMCSPERWSHLLGHAAGLGDELPDPQDVGGHVVHRLLLLHHLQLLQQRWDQKVEALHWRPETA